VQAICWFNVQQIVKKCAAICLASTAKLVFNCVVSCDLEGHLMVCTLRNRLPVVLPVVLSVVLSVVLLLCSQLCLRARLGVSLER
jgi:hypothetical protein